MENRRNEGDKDRVPLLQSTFEITPVDNNQPFRRVDEKSFMENKIKRRECKCYIESHELTSGDQEYGKFCRCGKRKKDHAVLKNVPSRADSHEMSRDWNPDKHTHMLPTNAYGEIEFVDAGNRVAKYARVASNTKMTTVMEMLTEVWKLRKPKLLISVTGSTEHFEKNPRLRDKFRRCLMEATLMADAWIVTEGNNKGITKFIGESIHDYGIPAPGRITAIGIAPWGCVQNRKSLINEQGGGKWPASYRTKEPENKSQTCLEPNHSHFILVDNGTQQQYAAEVDFRNKLEEAIGYQQTDTGTYVPVCLLVLNGDIRTLKKVHSTITKGHPTIIVKGTGTVADILAFAYENVHQKKVIYLDSKRNEIRESHPVLDAKHTISNMMKEKLGIGDDEIAPCINLIEKIFGKKDLISVIELEHRISARGVDLAILSALLNANKYPSEKQDRVKRAQDRNELDVVKSEFFTQEKYSDEGSFMKDQIKQRECRCYIDKNRQSSEDTSFCICGHDSENHPPFKCVGSGTVWKWDEHTSLIPTNAFGEIGFHGYKDRVAKYVRAAADTKMTTIMEMLTETWRIKKPNLVISVIGGTKHFDLNPRLREAIRHRLTKAALSTGTWIVTGGNHTGVTKFIGETVLDYNMTASRRVISIGIAPWGCVQNKECLIDEQGDGKWPASYQTKEPENKNQTCLEPNHSHFILVDNGTQQQWATEADFRDKLEEAIGYQTAETGTHVPVCLLVLNGGTGTLEKVHSAMTRGHPTIIIKGSGRAADILAYAYENVKQEKVIFYEQKENKTEISQAVLEQGVLDQISCMVKDNIDPIDDGTYVNMIKESVTKTDLMTVFDLDAKNSATDVDLSILNALLKAKKDQAKEQLRLALALDRIDVVESEFFVLERNMIELNDIMMLAITLNRVDFVDFLLSHGFSLKHFLTKDRFSQLFKHHIPETSYPHKFLCKALKQEDRPVTPQDVQYLIQDLWAKFWQSEPNCNDIYSVQFPKPARDLFMWAILTNRYKLAKLFWREAEEPVALAICGQATLKSLKRYILDARVLDELRASINDYEQLAIGIINRCYSHDNKLAHDILMRNMTDWLSTSCIMLAYYTDNKLFLTQRPCKRLLTAIWMGKMKVENTNLKLLLCFLVFPLIPLVIKFEESDTRTIESAGIVQQNNEEKTLERKPGTLQGPRYYQQVHPNTEQNVTGYLKQKIQFFFSSICAFYQAPLMNFLINVISHLIFLGLYSYILIVELSEDFSFWDGFLLLWVFNIFLEEVRQFLSISASTLKGQWKYYAYNQWNIVDILTILLFIFGVITRSFKAMTYARILLSFNLITFFLRLLQFFSYKLEPGIMTVMIGKMVKDIIWSACILIVFICAYAVASEALLYPNSELNLKSLYYIPRKAFWSIFGEFSLDDIEGQNSCTNDPDLYKNYSEPRCPAKNSQFIVSPMLGVYTLLTNVLLINLLIAKFGFTIQKIHDKSNLHWAFQRFILIYDYSQRPSLPPPFIFISHLILIWKGQWRCSNNGENMTRFCRTFKNDEKVKQLIEWEKTVTKDYLNAVERDNANSNHGKMNKILERLELTSKKAEDNHQRFEKRLENVENQLCHIIKSLERLTSALEDNPPRPLTVPQIVTPR